VRAPASDDALRSISSRKSGGSRTCGDRKQHRRFAMDFISADCHPCAGKQVWIVKIARHEQGSVKARRRCNK